MFLALTVGLSRGLRGRLRLVVVDCSWLLHRIVQRCGRFKVGVGCLQVVRTGDLRRIANALADDVGGKSFGELRLPGGSLVLEQLRPRL